jgi:hypothetical protein
LDLLVGALQRLETWQSKSGQDGIQFLSNIGGESSNHWINRERNWIVMATRRAMIHSIAHDQSGRLD